MFGTVLISIFSMMHIYVFWRAASVPYVKLRVSRKILIGTGLLLWIISFLGRVIGHGGTGALAETLEFFGMNWMAVIFLLFIPLLAIDITTLFGILMPRISASLRGWALLAGALLSLFALFQGLRPPVIEPYEVSLPSLPKAFDGTVFVALSDMHLGSQLGERWLADRIAQVQALRPDLVVLLGDIFEGHSPPAGPLIAKFKQLSAPLGVWAVPGNHEFHGRENMSQFAEVGIKILRNAWSEPKPGLVLAGVDDLTTRYRRGQGGDPISQALAGRPPGTAILFSHTPWQAPQAAAAGVGLMLCGHTHGGQIWPFDYLVRSRYPLLEGRYDVNGMPVIVSRGTGTWGPRMRLWRPGEILRVTLRRTGAKN